MIPAIKIYGERNCGTNYLEKLIELNLECNLLKLNLNRLQITLLKNIKYDFVYNTIHKIQRNQTLGWKHGCPPLQNINKFPDPLLIITITKNPYAYISSLYKKPYHIKGAKPDSILNFIKHKWKTRERDLTDQRILKSPIELWNIKNHAYLSLSTHVKHKVVNTNYEELIQDPERFIRKIAAVLNLELKRSNSFQNYEDSTKSSGQKFTNYQDFYLNKKWLDQFDSESLQFSNSILNYDLMKRLGYSVEKNQK